MNTIVESEGTYETEEVLVFTAIFSNSEIKSTTDRELGLVWNNLYRTQKGYPTIIGFTSVQIPVLKRGSNSVLR